MKREVPLLSVDYEEYHLDSYKGVVLKFDNGNKFRFFTNDFKVDYISAMDAANALGCKEVCEMSSVFNYICDLEHGV